MQKYTKKEWIERLDDMGRAGQDCVFAISFDCEEAYVWPSDALPQAVAIQMPQFQHLRPVEPLPQSPYFERSPVTEGVYRKAYNMVQQHLRRGNSYLLNLCFPTPLKSNLSLDHFFAHAQAPYKLLIAGEFCSFSPEPFIKVEQGFIRTYPMKGTIPASILNAYAQLMDSEKEMREHATIVDLMRNDLSLVSHGVSVPRYRYAEELQTATGRIIQTSSEVCGQLDKAYQGAWGTLLAKLLPAGSISGAPKEWTLRAIAEAEPDTRGFYTGVFGCVIGGVLESAVCIRYVEQSAAGQLLYKSGGGITVLSDWKDEYDELLAKVYVPFSY